MSCRAILKNLYGPKMDVIFDHSLQNNSGNRDNKTYVLCPTLQKRTCIGVLKCIIMFFHSFIAMECAFTLFFTVNSSINVAGNHLAGGSFMEKALN